MLQEKAKGGHVKRMTTSLVPDNPAADLDLDLGKGKRISLIAPDALTAIIDKATGTVT